jgi:hypothetical protein
VSNWLPQLRKKFPCPAGNPSSWRPFQHIRYLYHNPEFFQDASLAFFPSHLHIDIVARGQRKGLGRTAVLQMLDKLRHSGSHGVFLEMSSKNSGAYRFYQSLGFFELFRRSTEASVTGEHVIFLGMSLSPVPIHPTLSVEQCPPVPSGYVCGIIEGFYGVPWSLTDRKRLALMMHLTATLNTYVYAPKDDRHHRMRWRSLYGQLDLCSLSYVVHLFHSRDIRFTYALSPGLDFDFSNDAETDLLKCRFRQLADIGVRDFALFFDDIPPVSVCLCSQREGITPTAQRRVQIDCCSSSTCRGGRPNVASRQYTWLSSVLLSNRILQRTNPV